VAKAENAAVLLEDDYVTNYDGFDPKSVEGNIFFSMLQNAFLDNSLAFASGVETQFSNRLSLFSRGVKQAGFLVLYKTAMPGVLIETGFLSNPKDEKYLLSDEGQGQIASAIYRAFKEYKHLKEFGTAAPPDTSRIVLSKADTLKPLPRKDDSVKSLPKKETVIDTRVHYKVQFATSPEKKLLDLTQFKAISNVKMYRQDGLCKYTSGDFATLEEASILRKDIMEKGFKDAFVVAFFGDKRITLKEAAELAGK
jgi:N-acetylmuramoyl-L-alanine amidase